MARNHPLFDLIDSAEFIHLLRQHLLSLPASRFDLQQALQRGSVALPETLHILLLKVERETSTTTIRIGLFFQSVIAGCNCADDPSPIDTLEEYASASLILDPLQGLREIHFD